MLVSCLFHCGRSLRSVATFVCPWICLLPASLWKVSSMRTWTLLGPVPGAVPGTQKPSDEPSLGTCNVPGVLSHLHGSFHAALKTTCELGTKDCAHFTDEGTEGLRSKSQTQGHSTLEAELGFKRSDPRATGPDESLFLLCVAFLFQRKRCEK